MNVHSHFYIFLTALFGSLFMIPMLRRWAIKNQEYDIPDSRKIHVSPVPRVGGVAIFVAFLFVMLALNEVNDQTRGLLAGGLVLFITGLVDDLYGLSPKKKFLGQIGASIVTIWVGHLYISHLGDLFGRGDIVLPIWIAIPFTIVALVGVTNAVNMLDGLDGLAGGFSVISVGAFLVLGYHHDHVAAIVLSVALLGGLLGFLQYNTYPAVIFMGDAGSLTVGFLLGFLAVLMTQGPGSCVCPVVPFVILGLPILDTLRVMGCRICRRTNPFKPDKTHVHHKFLDLGLSHRSVVMVIYALSLFWAIIAVAFSRDAEHLLFFTYVGSMACFYLTLQLVLLEIRKS